MKQELNAPQSLGDADDRPAATERAKNGVASFDERANNELAGGIKVSKARNVDVTDQLKQRERQRRLDDPSLEQRVQPGCSLSEAEVAKLLNRAEQASKKPPRKGKRT